jgi:hypothetical protein
MKNLKNPIVMDKNEKKRKKSLGSQAWMAQTS